MKNLFEPKSVPVPNEILMYLHCSKCIEELPLGSSPRGWAKLEVGWTEKGLQIWCRRHNCNVIHIDFGGQKHIAETRAEKPRERIKK
jgi:hypothetical protein